MFLIGSTKSGFGSRVSGLGEDSRPQPETPNPKPQTRSPKSGFALLIGLIVLCAVGKVILADTLDPDCFWHLRVGEEISRMPWPGALVDDLSFSSMREPWTPYSWLAELTMKRLWDIGGY